MKPNDYYYENYEAIIENYELLANLNHSLIVDSNDIKKKIFFFLARYMKSLDMLNKYYPQNIYLNLEKKISLDNLKRFSKLRGKIIVFNTFLTPKEDKIEKENSSIFTNFINYLYYLFNNKEETDNNQNTKEKCLYKTKIQIMYDYDKKNVGNCYVKDSFFIFQFFSFFKIRNAEVNKKKLEGTILLDCIGRREIFEKKFNVIGNFIYNSGENIISIV